MQTLFAGTIIEEIFNTEVVPDQNVLESKIKPETETILGEMNNLEKKICLLRDEKEKRHKKICHIKIESEAEIIEHEQLHTDLKILNGLLWNSLRKRFPNEPNIGVRVGWHVVSIKQDEDDFLPNFPFPDFGIRVIRIGLNFQ